MLKEGKESHKIRGTFQELKPVSKAQKRTAPLMDFGGTIFLEKRQLMQCNTFLFKLTVRASGKKTVPRVPPPPRAASRTSLGGFVK